jgi:hypothetical protein
MRLAQGRLEMQANYAADTSKGTSQECASKKNAAALLTRMSRCAVKCARFAHGKLLMIWWS